MAPPLEEEDFEPLEDEPLLLLLQTKGTETVLQTIDLQASNTKLADAISTLCISARAATHQRAIFEDRQVCLRVRQAWN